MTPNVPAGLCIGCCGPLVALEGLLLPLTKDKIERAAFIATISFKWVNFLNFIKKRAQQKLHILQFEL